MGVSVVVSCLAPAFSSQKQRVGVALIADADADSKMLQYVPDDEGYVAR